LWSIKELFEQEKRVKKGYFPKRNEHKWLHELFYIIQPNSYIKFVIKKLISNCRNNLFYIVIKLSFGI
jgi:hypothetical protein